MDSNLLAAIINRSTICTIFDAYLKGTRFENEPYRSRRYCKWKVIADNTGQRWLGRLISLLGVWEVKFCANLIIDLYIYF